MRFIDRMPRRWTPLGDNRSRHCSFCLPRRYLCPEQIDEVFQMMKLAVIESESEERNRWSMIVTFLVDNNQRNEEKKRKRRYIFSFFLAFSGSQLAFILLLLLLCRSFVASVIRPGLSNNRSDTEQLKRQSPEETCNISTRIIHYLTMAKVRSIALKSHPLLVR